MSAAPSAFFGAFSPAAGTSPRTQSINVGTGTGARAILGAFYLTDGSSDSITAVSVGGQSLTNLLTARGDTDREWTVWGGVITGTGTQTLSGSFSGDSTYTMMGAYVVIDDVDGAAPFGTAAAAAGSGTTPSIGSQTCPADGLLLGFMSHFFAGSNPSYTGGGTSLIATRLGGGTHPIGVAHRNNTGGHSWSTASSQEWSVIVVPVNGLSGGTAPTITAQPEPETVVEGTTAGFSVTATGTGLTYQWEVDDGGGFDPVSTGAGGTTASYTTAATTLAMDGYLYRCVVTGDTSPPATSSSVELTVEAADVTAPVLSSPTGAATGPATATVGATTNEGSGTLYAFVSTSAAAPSDADLITGAGSAWAGSQVVTSTGAKTLSATGLTASTGYYAHLLHRDAASNDSNTVTSALFTTTSADPVAPVITGPSGAPGASTSAVSVPENTTAVHTFTADEVVTWAIRGGADEAMFSLNESTGALAFLAAPNFESPSDSDTNNAYVVIVRAADTSGNISEQTVTVTVTNANEAPTFQGTAIGSQTGTVGVALTPLDVSSQFVDVDAGDTATYSAVGTWPAGVTVSTAGVISGTPTEAGTFTALAVRRTDSGSLTVDSNTFTFTVASDDAPGFDFDTEAGCVFGAIVGALTGIAMQTEVDIVVRAYDPTTGALIAESGTLTTDATGRLARWEDAVLAASAEYHLVFVRVSDGAIACKTLTTT